MRAVLYCRVSTTEQTKNLSLSTQEKACREYCERNGYDVDRVFVDAGESAKSTDRPEFLRLLSYCREQKGRLHAVVVYSLTRFSRQQADHHAIMTLLRGLGISLRSVTEPIDESPSGKLMEGILAAMAQFDNDVKSERVTAGLKAAMERGRWVNRPPLGYLAGPRGGPSLVPDPERASLVLEAFALAASGVRGRHLLQQLAARGLMTRHGHRLTTPSLYSVLRNRAYLGCLKGGTATERRGDFAPLVDEETFARVQVQLDNAPTSTRAIVRHRNHPGFPLRRFARCAVCDRPLTGSTSKGRRARYAFYHCPKGCTRVRAADLEEHFLALLDRLRPKPDRWALMKACILAVWQEGRQKTGPERRLIKKNIATMRAKCRRLDHAFLYDRSIDQVTYHAERDSLREKLAVAEIELAGLADQTHSIDDDLDFSYDVCARARVLWVTAATLDRRVHVQWALFPNGIVVANGSKTKERSARPEPRISAVSCLDFFELTDVSAEGERDGAGYLRILEPDRVAAWLGHIHKLRLLAHAA
jgi:site-specific DNA recombinase